jgi:hypothetical protein
MCSLTFASLIAPRTTTSQASDNNSENKRGQHSSGTSEFLYPDSDDSGNRVNDYPNDHPQQPRPTLVLAKRPQQADDYTAEESHRQVPEDDQGKSKVRWNPRDVDPHHHQSGPE